MVAPGNRLSFVVDVTLKTGMHVYAPGDHGYQVIRLRVTAPDFLRSHAVTYPPSEMYHFEPLDETVAVYEEPFRLVQDVTISMRRDINALASELGATVAGAGQRAGALDDLLQAGVQVEARADAQDGRAQPGETVPQHLPAKSERTTPPMHGSFGSPENAIFLTLKVMSLSC